MTPHGQTNGNARLTDDDVRMIRELLTARDGALATMRRVSIPKIAEKFGVHPNTIKYIQQGYTWSAP